MRGRAIFPLRSNIWRLHRVARRIFRVRRWNFGDLRTFNAVIWLLLIFACILRAPSPKMGRFGKAKWGKKWCDVYPQRTRFYFWGFCVLENPSRNANVRLHADGHTDRGKLVLCSIPCYMGSGTAKQVEMVWTCLLVDRHGNAAGDLMFYGWFFPFLTDALSFDNGWMDLNEDCCVNTVGEKIHMNKNLANFREGSLP